MIGFAVLLFIPLGCASPPSFSTDRTHVRISHHNKQIKLINIASSGHATQSSTRNSKRGHVFIESVPFSNRGSHSSQFAIDGNFTEFYEIGLIAETMKEKDPWWQLQLPKPEPVSLIEILVPRSWCLPLTKHFIKNLQQKRCRSTNEQMGVSKIYPLSLEGSIGHTSVFRQHFDAGGPLLIWRSATRAMLVNLLKIVHQGMHQSLALGQVKVFVQRREDTSCKSLHCMHGKCTTLRGIAKCVCEPDFVGEQCETFLLTSWRYNPPTLRPAQNWFDDKLQTHLLNRYTSGSSSRYRNSHFTCID